MVWFDLVWFALVCCALGCGIWGFHLTGEGRSSQLAAQRHLPLAKLQENVLVLAELGSRAADKLGVDEGAVLGDKLLEGCDFLALGGGLRPGGRSVLGSLQARQGKRSRNSDIRASRIEAAWQRKNRVGRAGCAVKLRVGMCTWAVFASSTSISWSQEESMSEKVVSMRVASSGVTSCSGVWGLEFGV